MLERLSSPFVLLEDRLGPAPGGLLYQRPHAIIRCDTSAELSAALERLEGGLEQGHHAAGLLSYELGYLLEPRLGPLAEARPFEPYLWFGLFDPPERISAERLDAMFGALPAPPPIQLQDFEPPQRHIAKVESALRLIEAGDIYQVNLTFKVRFRSQGASLHLYAALRAGQPVAHGGVVALGDLTVLSTSPELWVSVESGQATTRPMKGTAARGVGAEADVTARETLVADPKQRAENLMIVDLLRNDLARISEPGSVQVPELFTVETYPNFHTLTSTITSRLLPGLGLREKLAALFPCGSIVGAPKIRAAEIAHALEGSSRGVYTGAIGAFAPGGDLKFNVAIRTAVVTTNGDGRYGVGGGIVVDSEPRAEYQEALLKARVLTDLAEDYGLIETFRWSQNAGFVRLGLHLERLARSARELGFTFDRIASKERLQRLEIELKAEEGDRRVRLQLHRNGALEITHSSLPPSKPSLRVCLATERLDPGDPFLRHKTTRREVYERAFAAAVARGLDEAILLNRRGEVAEASRSSVFVEAEGRLITPPLSAGLLPGVLRQELLANGRAIEMAVTPEGLSERSLWLGNSLHGLRRAHLER